MEIEKILAEKKAEIITKWTDLVLDSYESSNFFKTQKNRIANPIGANISEGLKELFERLLEGAEPDSLAGPLNTIIKIRAVQDFNPSEAVSFLFLLKKVIREELAHVKQDGTALMAPVEFDAGIDKAVLMAFDIYMACKERLFQIRMKEIKNGTHILTDGTKCASARFRKMQIESAEDSQTNSST